MPYSRVLIITFIMYDKLCQNLAMAQKTDKVLSQHNKARLNTQTDIEGKLRQAVIVACDKYLNQENNKSSS